MAIYNITYKAPDDKDYLWNGSTFDLVKEENEKLFFSGKSYNEDEMAEALLKSYKAAKQLFPADNDIHLEPVEIPVSDQDTEGGHRHRMTS
ncbi:hypothetical protein [Mucilaginibacter ginsenosidivorans]|uniref:Uncharacterized protein n=1 Tax=Mucilaginibacter ginsenosidivorans TaxID=398053 RepID=A0A5B8UVP8_9SPHI|nr:hypothetical protein [Mucilaginibacter ginsenosidivorans]QEC63144.1 hypothetical protein FRZ54_11340 [Mucilaginibacter ginsenosidivorans]